MNKFLFTPITTFSLQHTIYLCEDDNMFPIATVDTWDLARQLVDLCVLNNITTVKVAGQSNFIDAVIADIVEIEQLTYSRHYIVVEKVGLN